jgi:DNA repair photolyase
VETIAARSLLTPTGGYLGDFTHSLNPYQGCVIGCPYCYVAHAPVAARDSRPWGTYFKAKGNAPAVLRRELARHPPGTLRIFMSSATDPYQAPERRLGLTRQILEALAERPPALLVVQTRTPLVARDADVLQALGPCVLVSMTIETDREDVRRLVTPRAAPLAERRAAIAALKAEGIRTQVAVSPLLPHDPAAFAAWLAGCCDYVVVDTFAAGDGAGGRRTARSAIPALYAAHGWGDWRSVDTGPLRTALTAVFGGERVLWSQEGFNYFASLAARKS